jgi:hypothetical protein
VENLSHEHVSGVVDDRSSVVEAAGGEGAVSVTLARPVPVSLADLPADAPPPALWSKLEAQLRREGIITS